MQNAKKNIKHHQKDIVIWILGGGEIMRSLLYSEVYLFVASFNVFFGRVILNKKKIVSFRLLSTAFQVLCLSLKDMKNKVVTTSRTFLTRHQDRSEYCPSVTTQYKWYVQCMIEIPSAHSQEKANTL